MSCTARIGWQTAVLPTTEADISCTNATRASQGTTTFISSRNSRLRVRLVDKFNPRSPYSIAAPFVAKRRTPRKKARFSAIQSASTCARPRDSSHQVPVPARTSNLLIADENSLLLTGFHRCSNCGDLGTFPASFWPSRLDFRNLMYLEGRTVLPCKAPIAERACQAANTIPIWGKRAAPESKKAKSARQKRLSILPDAAVGI